MIGFLLKKNFFDTWDNFFKIALLNAGFLGFAAIPVFVPALFISVPALEITILLIGILWCFVYLSAAARSLKRISDYGSFTFFDFIENLKTSWPGGLTMGALAFALLMLSTVTIPFYLSFKSMIGLLLAAFIFWSMVSMVLALQFFFSLQARLETGIWKAIKKCFIIFIDNPAFCVFSLAHNLFLALICLFPVFLIVPGPAGMLLFLDQGLRLRLMKYDWLESEGARDSAAEAEGAANGEATGSATNGDAGAARGSSRSLYRKKIPWDAILIDEREKTGNRSLKSFIFPWKD